MTDADDLRRLFLLRDDVAFLNHGSFGACPRTVFDAYQALQRELEAEPVDFLARERTLPGRLAAARARLAAFVGADRDEIVFVPNTTTGLNIVARSLDLRPGDEILSTDHEYGAMDRTWAFVCGKTGASYVRRPQSLPLGDPREVVDAVWGGVNECTRVLFVSHIASTSGVRLPVEELVARARERGIFTIIDGAHGPGQLDLDLHALGADVYVGNCHKWLMSPKGAALLYVRADRQDLVEPLAVSWGWRAEKPGPSRFVDEQEWIGTRDVSSYLAVPAALDFFAQHDWPRVRERCRELLRETRERLLAVVRLPAPCPPDPWLLQMAVVPLPAGVDATVLQRTLRRDHLVEVPVSRFADRDWLRVSIHGYNTSQDVDRLVAALRAELG